MVATAAHLVDNVLPRVPYRQWVLALPKRLRYFLHRDAGHAGARFDKLTAGVLRIFLRAVETAVRDACPSAPPKARFLRHAQDRSVPSPFSTGQGQP
jgi:hypothetical protein